MSKPYISIIIPVYNEEPNLQKLLARLYPVMTALGKPFEIIFTDDGSRDRSLEILREMAQSHPEVKVIEFNGNFGQHMAIMAAFEMSAGEIVVTLDADLQNPPEEIPKLVAEMEKGHDVVGSVRQKRQDTFFRRAASRIVNITTNKMTGMQMSDYGCMLRAYNRTVIDNLNRCQEMTTFIPALAQTFASNPSEVPVSHAERAEGESKYSLYRLIRLNFDLMTGFSVVPLQLFALLGILTSVASVLFALFLLVRRFLIGSEVEGVFTLFAILFFFVGIIIFGIGLVGEYVGRIYQEVRRRPRYVVRRTYGFE
ncbi:glycosyl transferase family 2 [Geobacter metallireducens RCH3]|uniref:UDP-4-deoxy-4-formamido-L-arabinose--undecaprenyl-phosphate 4-deoxy-4-formamido-L-arabinosyltransferase n=1 Tax=Geobacter metallireducens (strain ATCC 53774 / DSM 7210 / GS-15) TaxID=269799 RepID=Q39X97_GEOMG|nr:glycosyltransferase [Geobacter metallireducens]ABB31127.1 UDP-4-deoxy-4-formamido-L-arabinose--undecaprenyl-phosphate 4-deoxy-4-formamido-L-arabinosyltransferase [Geobacter metallireducens GS-15]EHP86909.1 glycosyl transferase family 2 [Geobacter metallireducens RCH3]